MRCIKSIYYIWTKIELNKHVIMYEYVLRCLFPAATLEDNMSHSNKKNVNE